MTSSNDDNAPGAGENAQPQADDELRRAAGETLSHIEGKRIKGVFSTQRVEKVGTGTTSRRTVSKTYWYVEELDDGSVEVQPLNKNNVPSGEKQAVERENFLNEYQPEPEFYQQKVFPRLRELRETVKRAEQHREDGALYSAQFEYENALNVDEENVRANFGLGLTYLSRGDTAKAGDILKRIVTLDAAFQEEHKHLFNDFGINLRKTGMHAQAVEYYTRALEMTGSDENLHYNMARAYFEKGEAAKCREHLDRALELNPEFEEAQKFIEYMTRQDEEK